MSAAAARALFMHPKVILADEPTANLDADSAVQLIDALVDTVAQQGVALLLVTHDPRVAVRADRRLRLDRGVIASL
jgi:ABC-type lipoprotein export system ATPase subunit